MIRSESSFQQKAAAGLLLHHHIDNKGFRNGGETMQFIQSAAADDSGNRNTSREMDVIQSLSGTSMPVRRLEGVLSETDAESLSNPQNARRARELANSLQERTTPDDPGLNQPLFLNQIRELEIRALDDLLELSDRQSATQSLMELSLSNPTAMQSDQSTDRDAAISSLKTISTNDAEVFDEARSSMLTKRLKRHKIKLE